MKSPTVSILEFKESFPLISLASTNWDNKATECGGSNNTALVKAVIIMNSAFGCSDQITIARLNRAPGQEFLRRTIVGPARVRVADIGGEEFEEAHRGTLASSSNECRQRGRDKRDDLVHRRIKAFQLISYPAS